MKEGLTVFSESYGNRLALIGRNGKTSFSQLRNGIEAYKKGISSRGLTLLPAGPDVHFLTALLAHLEAGVPVAPIAPTLSSGELKARQDLLKKQYDPDCALVLFTSGTTGPVKAVQLSRQNIASNLAAVVAALDFANVESQRLFLPLWHAFGLLGQLLPALSAGITTHLGSFFELQANFSSTDLRGMLSGVPAQLETLLRVSKPEDCLNVTRVVSAGGVLSLSLRQRLACHFSSAIIYNNYGLTEASPRVLSLPSTDPYFFADDTLGFPLKHIKIRSSAKGELLVSGKQVMLGYLGEGERAGDWLNTGDIVSIDANGLVRYMGRRDDLVKIGGERTSMFEIDSALAKVNAIVEAAAALGPGNELAAFIVAKGKLDRKTLLQQLRLHLSASKVPKEFYQIDALPRTESGKLIRSQLNTLKATAQEIV